MENPGEQFLHKKDKDLYTSSHVEHANTAESSNKQPADKISAWLKVIEKTHMSHQDKPEVLERIKNYYHKEHVIKSENIPESTFLLEQRIARQGGHGNVEITESFKEAKANQIINDQKHSLDRWVTYLSSPDSSDIPTWAKYWAFKSMLKMGKFEKQQDEENQKETAAFKKRTKDTVAPFAPLNPLALRNTLTAIKSKVSKEEFENTSAKLKEEEYKKLLNTESFSKLYTQFLIELPEYSKEGLKETRGEWIKYNQGSSPDELVASLDGYPLEWCTANPDTARSQLQGGDFYIYYSLNNTGEAKIPRLAIRMEGDEIAEDPRGIAPNQNLDPYITPVLDEKLSDFGNEAEKYKKKSENMKRMTEIEERNEKGEELTEDDLRFLYQIDSKIEGFGYEDDPRIEELLEGRDKRADLSLVIGCSPEEISLTQEEALSGGIKYHYGDLNLSNLTSAVGLTLPESIGGDLSLNGLSSSVGLTLPESIGGNLNLSGLKSAEGLTLPESIGGNLSLNSLKSAEGLNLPESIEGGLYLRSLTSAEGLTLPERIGGDLYLSNLTSAEGLTLPESIGKALDLRGLTSAEGLNLPESIGGGLYLSNLTSAEGLTLPERIGGGLYLNSLKSAEGLTLPTNIGGDLSLNNLTSAEGLTLPESIGGSLDLGGLTSAERNELRDAYPQHKISPNP